MKKGDWLYGVAVLAGIAVWVVVAELSGREEAWDSEWYFLLGMPVGWMVAAGLGIVEPSRPWRWGLVPLVAQAVWMIATEGVGNLLPLGLVVFGVLAIPSVVTAWLGALVGKRVARVNTE